MQALYMVSPDSVAPNEQMDNKRKKRKSTPQILKTRCNMKKAREYISQKDNHWNNLGNNENI